MSLLVLTACGGSDDASEPAPSPIVLDSDADGVADDQDAFPNDANEWLDSDNDGFGDNSDAFVDDASEWLDSDGDGVGDNSDVFVNDASEWADSDGDGVGDNADAFPNDPNRWSEAVTLQLPQQLDNYAAVALPAHYLSNDFSDNNPFQRAAIVLDNTPADNGITDAGATLGRVLFYDKKLSANGTVACASCHQQAHAFSDSQVQSTGFEGGLTRRHSIGLANVRFYASGKFFWDERAASLEEQVLMPFQDPVEMGLTLTQLEQIVQQQSYYPPLFNAAFGDNTVSHERIAQALAQFQRSIVSTQSKYDIARANVTTATQAFPGFTALENQGKDLFFRPRDLGNGEVANCAGCHISEAFVGLEVPGQFATTAATNNGLDDESVGDLGVFETTMNVNDIGKFKTPSLVNVGARPPYMHDGRFATLEEVIDHYSQGIQPHPNLANQLTMGNGEPVKFNFSDEEKAALVAFLHTLTDHHMLSDEKLSDPFMAP